MSKTPENYVRIGVQLNPQQISNLRNITARLGIAQNRLMCAVAQCITDDEIASLMARFEEIKLAEAREKARLRLQAIKGSIPQAIAEE